MKRFSLRQLVFMALCCDFGLVFKKVISPLANLTTEALHIPGGISTAFSLAFIVIAAGLVNRFGAGLLMSLVQCVTALALGSAGSMGPLAVIGFAVPGLLTDLCLLLRRTAVPRDIPLFLACLLGSVSAAFCANTLVFGLRGPVLLLYLFVSAAAGAVAGIGAAFAVEKLRRALPGLFSAEEGPRKRPRENTREAPAAEAAEISIPEENCSAEAAEEGRDRS